MKESGGIEWRHVAVPILAMICFFFIWALIPLYGSGHLLIGIGLPSAAAWIVAGFAIRRGFVGRGSYGAVWGVYALAGAVFWEIVWDCYPIIFFWKPLMCEVFQGPASHCTVAQYLHERIFWMPFGFALILLPHSALSGLVFVIRSYLPDYRGRLST